MSQEVMRTQSAKPPATRTSQKLVGRLADKYGVQPESLLGCLRDTAFAVGKNDAPFSDTELAAALILCEKYDLNPFAREIYVTRNRGKLLVIVPIDGWAKIVNRHPEYDGCDFQRHVDDQGELVAITCNMYRKDRGRPVSVTEMLQECRRDTDPWKQWESRMLRHKAFIQAARLAFSLSGVIDDDEAERVIDKTFRGEARIVGQTPFGAQGGLPPPSEVGPARTYPQSTADSSPTAATKEELIEYWTAAAETLTSEEIETIRHESALAQKIVPDRLTRDQLAEVCDRAERVLSERGKK